MMISQYEQTIQQLTGQIEEYKVQTVQLNENLSCEKEFNSELTATNVVLTNKIKTAAVLDIPQVSVEAVKRNYRGTEVAVSKAKSAENLKICFETGANKALDPGTYRVELYQEGKVIGKGSVRLT